MGTGAPAHDAFGCARSRTVQGAARWRGALGQVRRGIRFPIPGVVAHTRGRHLPHPLEPRARARRAAALEPRTLNLVQDLAPRPPTARMGAVQRFPAVELFRLRGGQRDLSWRKAIPELLDELEALRRAESGDVKVRGGHGG